MNSDTQAPSGRSPPSMPSWNAQVAKTCVWSIGPPLVRMRTMSKLAKVTISENSTVMAMMLRIIGSVMYQIFCHRSEEHTSELQSLAYLVCRLLLEKKKKK